MVERIAIASSKCSGVHDRDRKPRAAVRVGQLAAERGAQQTAHADVEPDEERRVEHDARRVGVAEANARARDVRAAPDRLA